MRRSLAPRVGAVARRGVGGASADASFSASWLSAASRFCFCDRNRLALERTTSPRRPSTRARCAPLSATESTTRKLAITRVSDRFACWPPGPPEVVTRRSISSAGMVRRGPTLSEPSSWTRGPLTPAYRSTGRRTIASCVEDATSWPASSKSSQRSSTSPSAMRIAHCRARSHSLVGTRRT